jgi:hypothetical protein
MTDFLKRWHVRTTALDRWAMVLILGLGLIISLLVLWGDRTLPKVREFSWMNQVIGAEDTAFKLTFSRPMDWQSVTQQIQISPTLPGKTSWSGRRLAYTLSEPVAYGQSFRMTLQQATTATGQVMAPFTTTFKSRDLAFAYLGVNGDETDRLILYNVTRDQKTILTSKALSVIHFKPYPQGDRLLFSATERDAPRPAPVQLYRVTTGLNGDQTKPGQVELVLDGKDYQILKFDLSADGQRIVVQQAARQNMSETGLWQLSGSAKPERIKATGAGDFLIAPDSNTLVVAQGQGLALVALEQQVQPTTDAPLDFLPQFGMVLSFARDSSAAAMVKFNNDYTRSLFLVTNQGVQKELLRTKGSILGTSFTADRAAIYALLTRLLPGKDYREQPYIAKINLKTGQQTELLTLQNQQNVSLSLAPDDSQLLLDQSLTPQDKAAREPGTEASNIWSLPADQKTNPSVVAVGAKPQWLP